MALTNKRIMVAEDDEACQFLWQLLLEEAGATFSIAKNGQEAVSKVKADSFDVVFMDLRMPVMDGYKATSAIREINKDVPIIALTGFARAWDDGKCQACGMNDYLTKPCTKEQFFAKIIKWIGGIK